MPKLANPKNLILISILILLTITPVVLYFFVSKTEKPVRITDEQPDRPIIIPTQRPFDRTGFNETNLVEPIESNAVGNSIYSPRSAV